MSIYTKHKCPTCVYDYLVLKGQEEYDTGKCVECTHKDEMDAWAEQTNDWATDMPKEA